MTGWTTSVTSLHTSSRDTDTPFFALDRDSAQWKLGDKQVQRRRNLFWELFTLETIHVSWISTEEACSHSNTSQSMSLGRPPAITFSHIDCELPEDEEAGTNEDGTNLRGCSYRLFSFVT